MPHEHHICDSDKHFIIDPITRNITNQSSKITIMQYDHNSERFTFEIPKFIECHDMSLCDAVRIHFINIGSIKTDTASGVYEVDDVAVSLENPDTITFSWLIKGSSTKYNGSLNFAIRFYCFSDENVIDYSWGTNIYSGIKVSNGLENSDMIVEDYIDVLEKWKQDVIDICIQPATKTNLGCVKVGANLSITEDGTLSADAKEIEIDNETIVKTEDGKLKANISIIPKPLTYDYMPEGYPSKSGWGITWDGNTEGLVSVNNKVYKVSDIMPTYDELLSATIKLNNGLSLKLSSDDITALSEDITLIADGEGGFVLRKDNVTVGDTLFPQKGTYFPSADGFYLAELSCQTITPMAEEFLPPLVAEIQSAAEAAQDTADRKVDIENPNFTGAFSHNRKAGSIIGNMSFAEGCDTKAGGDYSHAEGHGTIAGGQSSHAEGEETTASGSYSHAEGGNTSASGQHSHAEGQKTIASGSWSHAEGYETTASGYRSHAEGIATEASGEQSHAEGESTIASGHNAHAEGHGTIASGHNSHVEGKYNVEDTSHKYAHIVGNGTEYVKSNAYTLDWDGNGWFAGNVEADANILRSSATDSTKKFKLTVDDSGVPSLTNTEDSTEVWTPSDGGSSVPKPLTYDYMPEGYPTKAMETVTLMEEQEVEFVFTNDLGVYWTHIQQSPLAIAEGKTYTVNWDGTEYECVCFVFNSIPALGNLSILGVGDDTGEPFAYEPSENAYITLDTSPTHTIGVKTTAETAIPMAEEFIPKPLTWEFIPKPLTYEHMPEGYPSKSRFTIEWDGNTEGFAVVENDYGGRWYKVSDLVVDPSVFASGATLTYAGGHTDFMSTDAATDKKLITIGPGMVTFGEEQVLVFSETPEAPYEAFEIGVYFESDKFYNVRKVTGGEVITPMAGEFIPHMNVSAFTNDAGYLTLATLPKYEGVVE